MSGWSCYIGSLAVAKELYTMGRMIGEDRGAGVAKATPARLTNDDWIPANMGQSRGLDEFSSGVAA